jgi:hypothetical protein
MNPSLLWLCTLAQASVNVMVATLSLFTSGWALTMFLISLFAKRGPEGTFTEPVLTTTRWIDMYLADYCAGHYINPNRGVLGPFEYAVTSQKEKPEYHMSADRNLPVSLANSLSESYHV